MCVCVCVSFHLSNFKTPSSTHHLQLNEQNSYTSVSFRFTNYASPFLRNDQRFVVGEAPRHLLVLVVVVVQAVPDAGRARPRVVVRVREPAEGRLQAAVPLDDVHDGDGEGRCDERRHEPQPRRRVRGRLDEALEVVLLERLDLGNVRVVALCWVGERERKREGMEKLVFIRIEVRQMPGGYSIPCFNILSLY